MRACKGCGGEFRKGTIAFLLSGKSKLQGANVCPKCVQNGVLIVPVQVPEVVQVDERKGQREVLEPFIKNLQARIKALKHVPTLTSEVDEYWFAKGKLEMLEDVVAMLKGGRA